MSARPDWPAITLVSLAVVMEVAFMVALFQWEMPCNEPDCCRECR